MEIGCDLTMNFYATVGNYDKTPSLRVTKNGVPAVIEGTLFNAAKNEYRFPLVISACEMADDLRLELLCDGVPVAEKASYSVRKYCQNLMAKTPAQLNMTSAEFARLKTMLSDLLAYGSAAQIYEDHNTSSLADAGIRAEDFPGIVSTDELFVTHESVGGTSLSVPESNGRGLTFVVCSPTPARTTLVIRHGTDEMTFTSSDYEKLSPNVYGVYAGDVNLSGYGDMFAAELYYNGRLVQTAVFSMRSYVYLIRDGSSAKDLMIKAAYTFCRAANAYLLSREGY